MKITTLIFTVVLTAIGTYQGTALAQSAVSSNQLESSDVPGPVKTKRTMSPDAIKRAKLTNLKKDVGLTGDQETRVKPIIDRYVDAVQATKHDPSLDSRAKRQQFATLRERYNTELDGVLTADQQQKLASIKAQRLARLRGGKTGSASGAAESTETTSSPAVVQ